MKFGEISSSLAIKSGLAAAGLQVLLFVILLVKTLWPDFDLSGAFSLAVLLGLAAGAFAGFWRLRQSPELGYFALAVGAGLFLFAAGFLAIFTVGLFVLPGSVAIIVSAIIFLLAGDDRLTIWRRAGIVLIAAVWVLLFGAQLYGAAYLLNVPRS